MKATTRKQREALAKLYLRELNSAAANGRAPTWPSYRALRKSAQRASYDDCLMIQWAGMWLGIERDGYTHS